MKVVLIVCAILCLFGLSAVRSEDTTELPITDEQAQCILDVLQNTEVDTETVGEVAVDIVETFSRLIQHYLRCEDILSDPPTALEERRHEACRLTWYATVLAELLRLRNQFENSEFFDQLIDQVQTCREM